MRINKIISDGKISLKNLMKVDCSEEYLQWLRNPELNKYLEVRHTPPSSISELESYVEEISNDNQNLLLGIFYEDLHIGNIKLGPICPVHNKASIGLIIGKKEYWGFGIATCAIKLITNYAFDELKLDKIEAGCYSENLGSYKAFIKANYSCEGVLKSSRKNGQLRDDELLLGYTLIAYKERKPIVFENIISIIFIGGGKLMCDAAVFAKEAGFKVSIVLSKRHSSENINDLNIQDYLRSLNIEFEIHDSPLSIDPISFGFDLQSTIAVCFGPAWIFPEITLNKFPKGMFNFNGIPLPKYQGGAHFTWQILNGDLNGGCNIQIITKKIDCGDIILSEKYQLPRELKIPMDYFKFNEKKGLKFIKNFINNINNQIPFVKSSYESISFEREYFPRLQTSIHGYINWEWNCDEIFKFCNAFDEPYLGARTFLNDTLVIIKKVSKIKNKINYHSFCSGLIIRKNDAGIFVATKGGILKIEYITDSSGKNISNLFEGDRFNTPIKYIENSRTKRMKIIRDGSIF